MAPFYGWGAIASRLPVWGDFEEAVYFFTTKFPEIPGTHFINLRRMRGWLNVGVKF